MNFHCRTVIKCKEKSLLLTRKEHTMPATKHMANHLTRVPKLSVEASRTLIGGEGRKKKGYYKPSFEQSKRHFLFTIESLISNKVFFFSQKQLFYLA